MASLSSITNYLVLEALNREHFDMLPPTSQSQNMKEASFVQLGHC